MLLCRCLAIQWLSREGLDPEQKQLTRGMEGQGVVQTLRIARAHRHELEERYAFLGASANKGKDLVLRPMRLSLPESGRLQYRWWYLLGPIKAGLPLKR